MQTSIEYHIFVWNAVLVINLHWVLLFLFSLFLSIELCALRLTTVMQAAHALIVFKCDDNLIDRKKLLNTGFLVRNFHSANLSQVHVSGAEKKGIISSHII